MIDSLARHKSVNKPYYPWLPTQRRIGFLQVVGTLGGAVVLFYAGVNYLIGNSAAALFQTLIAIIIFLAIWVSRRSSHLQLAMDLGVLAAFLISLHNFYSGGLDQTGILWVYLFPVIAFFLQGKSNGLKWMGFFGVDLFGLALAHYFTLILLPYDGITIITFLGSLVVMTMLLGSSQAAQDDIQELFSSNLDELRGANDQLGMEVRRREQVEVQLSKSLATAEAQHERSLDTQQAMTNLLEDYKKEKDEVIKTREQLEKVIETLGDGVVVVGANQEIRLVNHTAGSMVEYSTNDIKGKPFELIFKVHEHGDEVTQSDFLEAALDSGQTTTVNGNAFMETRSGANLPVMVVASPLRNSEDLVTGCVVVFRDMTDQRELDRMRSDFISVASHQLKSPAAGLKWGIEALLQPESGPLNDKQSKLVAKMEDLVDKMQVLLVDLLDVSKIEAGADLELRKSDVNVSSLLKEILDDAQAFAARHSMKLHFENEGLPGELTMKLDMGKIREAIKNIINNAIKYSKSGGHVDIIARKSAGNFILMVKDQGIGIPEKERANLFQKFFRASNARDLHKEGTGLGMYIVKSFIEAHGGGIQLTSREGEGTTIEISIPII
jgi:PAS domain S-box-containing protein